MRPTTHNIRAKLAYVTKYIHKTSQTHAPSTYADELEPSRIQPTNEFERNTAQANQFA